MTDSDIAHSLPDGLDIELNKWFDNFSSANATPLSSGYQGQVWLFNHPKLNLVIKTVPKLGISRLILKFTLRHEYLVYKKLQGVTGVPRCYGFYRNQFLVIEYIESKTLRQAELDNRDYFYSKLFTLIDTLHKRDIAHIDLKRKDNILVADGCEPYLVDFGAAVIRKTGFHPVNNYFFKVAKQFDLNAWIKHKYKRQFDQICEEDRKYYRRTPLESISSRVKKFYRRVIKR